MHFQEVEYRRLFCAIKGKIRTSEFWDKGYFGGILTIDNNYICEVFFPECNDEKEFKQLAEVYFNSDEYKQAKKNYEKWKENRS